MIKNILFFFLLGTGFIQAQSTAKKVLWIGNSYTYANDLPNLFRLLALSGNDTIIIDSSAPGGYTFANHTTNATTLLKLAQNNNDFVVLQAQSQEPSFPPSQVNTETFPYAAILDSLAHVGSPCSQTVFYMTWGRKFGDAQNCPNYPPLCTFQGMNDRLRTSYKQMADDNEALVSPAGVAWRTSWESDPTINLWTSDNSHPSLAGSYLTACVFYSTILRKSPVGLSYHAGLADTIATFLQQVAHQTVLDSLDTWNIGKWDVKSEFTFVQSDADVSFVNQSNNATTYSWDFGDGSELSTETSPNHTFDSGLGSSFSVQLIAQNACESDTSTLTVELNPTGFTKRTVESEWRVFPNPASKQVMIQASKSTQFTIEIYNSEGLLMRRFQEEGSLIPLSVETYSPGIYQVVCSSGKEQRIFRMLKN
jgi:hypothetical protein